MRFNENKMTYCTCTVVVFNLDHSAEGDKFLGSTHFLLASDTNKHTFNAGCAYYCHLVHKHARVSMKRTIDQLLSLGLKYGLFLFYV